MCNVHAYLILTDSSASATAIAVSAAALDTLTFLLIALSEVSLLLLLLTGCGLLPSLLASHGLLLLRSAQLLGYTAQPALDILLVNILVQAPPLHNNGVHNYMIPHNI